MVTATEPQVADTGKYSTKEAYTALGVSRDITFTEPHLFAVDLTALP